MSSCLVRAHILPAVDTLYNVRTGQLCWSASSQQALRTTLLASVSLSLLSSSAYRLPKNVFNSV